MTNKECSYEIAQGKSTVESGTGAQFTDGSAEAAIKALICKPENGKSYMGTVKTILPFGAIIEILPGKTGLLYTSEIALDPVSNIRDYLMEGDELEVQVILVDTDSGKTRLSRKALLHLPDNILTDNPAMISTDTNRK